MLNLLRIAFRNMNRQKKRSLLLGGAIAFGILIITLLNGFTAGLVVFILLLVITMVGITNTFRMIMLERTREIGTMRALGMQRGSVRNIFLSEALFIAIGALYAGLQAPE
ncbi:MAG: FtsX-like permease family protein [Spirochaeta sp.]|nr:FtsX-like permease family protein [Spirochaeta sp.]